MTYSAEVLADAPVAYWRLGELSGTAAADSNGSGTTYPGTYHGSPTLGQTGIGGAGGDTAVLFGSSAKYVDFGDVLENPNTGSGYTVEAWVRLPTGFSSGSNDPIIAKGNFSWRLTRYFGSSGATAQLNFTQDLGNPAPNSIAFTTANIDDGNWHHVVVTVSSTRSARAYYDGTLVGGPATIDALSTQTDPLRIANNGSDFWKGLVDEVAIYRSVLSATRVAAHYSAGVGTVTLTLPNAALTDEQTLTATLNPGATTLHNAGITDEQTLTATLSVGSGLHNAGITDEQTLAATLSVSVPTSTWVGDDEEQWQLPLQWSFIVDIEPVEDPPPATDRQLQQVSISMPAPTLVNGRPQQPWIPTVTRSDYGHYQLIIGGHDRSRPRGVPFLPLSDSDTEPFGDADASFAFPGLTEFDDPADWGLVELAPVRLRRKDPDGVFHTLWEGELASVEPDSGSGLTIHCIGVVYRVDLIKDPPKLWHIEQDRGDIITWLFNHWRYRYNLRIGHVARVQTGIIGVPGSDFAPAITGAVQDQLSEMTTDDGGQWTVGLARPRTPVVKLKDTTTVHATVSYGAPGVDIALPKDYTSATTGVYATGSNGHCSWMGARFPNYRGRDVPAFPLAVGAVFNPGDGQSGFAPFSNFLRAGDYGSISSGDTYLAVDIDEVKDFQENAGITVDGIVGAQTWEAAFQPGYNAGSIQGAYVDTLYEKPATRRRLHDQFGSDIGANPAYDPTVPAIQDYVPFGDNVPKHLARKSAKQIVDRNYPAGRVGDIILTTDPPEMHRMDIAAGMNIRVDNLAGGSVLVHVARVDRARVSGSVSITVDEKSRDLLTLAAIHQRDRDIADLTRREKFGRRRSKVFNDYGTWLCEDGAGEYPLENLQGGFWNVQRVAAAPKGSIERVSFCAGSGLTEAILNDNLGATPPASIPGAARFTVAIFTQPITARQLDNLPGLAAPLTSMDSGDNPWDYNEDTLTQKFGKILVVGGPGQACGFYPFDDPGDGTDTHLSGRFEDGGGVDFGPTGHYWLWVAVWSPVSCKIGGRLFPGAPA